MAENGVTEHVCDDGAHRNPEANLRVYRKGNCRFVEIDGKPFPYFTSGDLDLQVTEITHLSEMSGRTVSLGHIVMVPLYIGGQVDLDGGNEVLQGLH